MRTKEPKNANLVEMRNWALSITESREPDVTLYDGVNDPYLDRWFAVPRNPAGGVYVHRILRSDKDVPHDHPWDFTSYIVEGEYQEWTPDGIFNRPVGSIITRKAEDAHRLIVKPRHTVLSVVFIGPRRRDWGFHCPGGWMHWESFTGGDYGRMGGTMRGCGEPT